MSSDLAPLPTLAAWRHLDARDAFEALEPGVSAGAVVFEGHTTGVEEGTAFAVGYRIELDDRWHTRRADVWASHPQDAGSVSIVGDGDGAWTVDGVVRPDLDGCLEVDLESSACTNAFPLRRTGLEVGVPVECPAVYVRAFDLSVERLEQTYERRPDDGDHIVVHYVCERFEADFDLTYDRSGLIVDYPTLAVRAS